MKRATIAISALSATLFFYFRQNRSLLRDKADGY
jgi:hypothetical protein